MGNTGDYMDSLVYVEMDFVDRLVYVENFRVNVF